ncbi:MAG: ferrous iron transport protein A [Rhodocyclaceae bacterium]|nr:ferrous iron transport protein A [Rhodocyclaceae bacterium]
MQIIEMPLGSRARVTGLDRVAPAYRRKLLAMGLTPGVELTLLRIAPLGDPMHLAVRGSELSLRRGEAGAIEVEPLP